MWLCVNPGVAIYPGVHMVTACSPGMTFMHQCARRRKGTWEVPRRWGHDGWQWAGQHVSTSTPLLPMKTTRTDHHINSALAACCCGPLAPTVQTPATTLYANIPGCTLCVNNLHHVSPAPSQAPHARPIPTPLAHLLLLLPVESTSIPNAAAAFARPRPTRPSPTTPSTLPWRS